MSIKISFFLNIIIVFLLSYTFSQASELKIIPLKKPILSEEIIEKKITQNIIKPKQKPKKKIITKDEEIKPQKKPKKKVAKDKKIKPQKKPKKKVAKDKKIVKIEEEKTKLGIILPKEKPLVVSKKISKVQKKSKYYRKKDFSLAKKAIRAMEEKKWVKALSTGIIIYGLIDLQIKFIFLCCTV